jgi:CheY-specific phosphatase CheX
MTALTTESLAQTACEVLEETAFIFASPSNDTPPSDNPLVVAQLTVTGEVRGSLILAVPPSVGAEIAANLLGVEPDDPLADSKAADAVGEILNIMAGALAAHCAIGSAGWRLGPPTTRIVDDASQIDKGATGCDAVLVTDSGEHLWARVALLPGSCWPGAAA